MAKLSWPRRGWRDRRVWIPAVIVAVLAVAYAASFAIDEPLRRTVERRMNERLKGYTVRLGGLNFHPHGFSLDLLNLQVIQQANPDPPVMDVDRISASVQWRALLRARLVANMQIERPRLHINLAHLTQEAAEKVPVTERGWQDALQAAYPLKINEFRLTDGEITYVDPAKPFKPLRLTRVNAVAENIRNIKSAERTYPSPLTLKAAVFDTGSLSLDGSADFLAAPYPAVKAQFALDQMQMDFFQPVTRRYHIDMTGGVMATSGDFELSPSFAAARLEKVIVRDVTLDYVSEPAPETSPAKTIAGRRAAGSREGGETQQRRPRTPSKSAAPDAPAAEKASPEPRSAKAEKAPSEPRSAKAEKAPPEPRSAKPEKAPPGEKANAAEVAKVDRPDVQLAIDRVDVLHSTVGYVHASPDKPPYRVFFSDSDINLTGLTNQSSEAPAKAVMRGKFMGNGDTKATISFRPDEKGGNLNLVIEVQDTDMVAMNPLLESFGRFKVEAGQFSLYSEVAVKNGAIDGYVKPLFKGIVVQHQPEEQKSLGQKIKERVISAAAKILKNRPRKEVATKVDLSGPLDNPRTSVIQIVLGLVQNAFIKAILPGFDRSVQAAALPSPTMVARIGASVSSPTMVAGVVASVASPPEVEICRARRWCVPASRRSA